MKGGDIIQNRPRIYIVFLFLAFLLLLLEVISRKKGKRSIKNISFISKIEKVSKSSYIRWMHNKKSSKSYKKLKRAITQAGLSLSPEMVQFISCILPFIIFTFLLAIRYTNILNTMANINELQKVAEALGDSSIAQVNTKINWGLISVIALISYYLPRWILKLLGGIRNFKAQKEILMLQTYTIMMLKTNQSVKQILITLMDRTKMYKKPLEIAVNNYSENPHKAIQNLRGDIGNKDFDKITNTLEQVLKTDRKVSIKYLENHRVLGKELNRINQRTRNMKKNVIGILLMIIPLAMFLAIGGYPWFVFTLKTMGDLPI